MPIKKYIVTNGIVYCDGKAIGNISELTLNLPEPIENLEYYFERLINYTNTFSSFSLRLLRKLPYRDLGSHGDRYYTRKAYKKSRFKKMYKRRLEKIKKINSIN